MMNEGVQGGIAETLTWGCEVGVLCRGSTSEVHSAGKHIREVVFLGCQWFRVSNGSGKTFGVHG